MKRGVSAYLALLLVVACENNDKQPIKLGELAGVIQKGPFIQGSEVKLQNLDKDFNPSGSVYLTETNNDFGSFAVKNIPSGYVEANTSGYYYNEIIGKLSSSPITLSALALASQNKVLNINVLTTLSKARIEYLTLHENKSFSDAQQIAQADVLRAFKITLDKSINLFEELDLSKSDQGSSILLAISCILQNGNSEAQLSELITKVADDIRTDGELSNTSFKDALTKSAMTLEPDTIVLNLQKRYSALGLNVSIPSFNDYIDSDGDGVINLYQVKSPKFNLQPGEYKSDIKVELSCATSTAQIYYTTDNSTPTTSSTLYVSPIYIAGDGKKITIKAIAIKGGLANSGIASSTYSINYPQLDLSFSPPAPPLCCNTGETLSVDTNILISSTVDSVSIYYTIDGSEPNLSSALYTSGVPITGDHARLTIKAFAVKNQYKPSLVVTGSYGIEYLNAPPAVTDKLSGVYSSDIVINMSSVDSVPIYFTLDGSDPTSSSAIYSEPINLSGDGNLIVLKALTVGAQQKPTIIERAYKVDYSSNLIDHMQGLSVSDYNSMIVGKWVGYVSTPWLPPYNVEITISSDGTMKGDAIDGINSEGAWYWGADTDINPYSLNNVVSDGSAQGTFAFFGGTTPGTMTNVLFSNNGNYLTFQLFNRGEYGPVIYRLIRIPN